MLTGDFEYDEIRLKSLIINSKLLYFVNALTNCNSARYELRSLSLRYVSLLISAAISVRSVSTICLSLNIRSEKHIKIENSKCPFFSISQ